LRPEFASASRAKVDKRCCVAASARKLRGAQSRDVPCEAPGASSTTQHPLAVAAQARLPEPTPLRRPAPAMLRRQSGPRKARCPPCLR
jgi:hypothetical protein